MQASVLQTWQGKPENVAAAQRALRHGAEMNSAARSGAYTPQLENADGSNPTRLTDFDLGATTELPGATHPS